MLCTDTEPTRWVTDNMFAIILLLQKNLDIKDRRWHLKKRKACFDTKKAVTVIQDLFSIATRALAATVGEILRQKYVIEHVTHRNKPFRDRQSLFHFRRALMHLKKRRTSVSARGLYLLFSDDVSSSEDSSSIKGVKSPRRSIRDIPKSASKSFYVRKKPGGDTPTKFRIGSKCDFSLSSSSSSSNSSSDESWEDPTWVKEDSLETSRKHRKNRVKKTHRHHHRKKRMEKKSLQKYVEK